MSQRVACFIDSQNAYQGARRTFLRTGRRGLVSFGQFDPVGLGALLCERRRDLGESVLSEVRIYSGRPDPDRNRRTYEAHMRQCEVWEQAGARVIVRPLQYLHGQPPREKGIDVQIALDFVIGAIADQFDVGILISEDTDILPAIEFVAESSVVSARAELAACADETPDDTFTSSCLKAFGVITSTKRTTSSSAIRRRTLVGDVEASVACAY